MLHGNGVELHHVHEVLRGVDGGWFQLMKWGDVRACSEHFVALGIMYRRKRVPQGDVGTRAILLYALLFTPTPGKAHHTTCTA